MFVLVVSTDLFDDEVNLLWKHQANFLLQIVGQIEQVGQKEAKVQRWPFNCVRCVEGDDVTHWASKINVGHFEDVDDAFKCTDSLISLIKLILPKAGSLFGSSSRAILICEKSRQMNTRFSLSIYSQK